METIQNLLAAILIVLIFIAAQIGDYMKSQSKNRAS